MQKLVSAFTVVTVSCQAVRLNTHSQLDSQVEADAMWWKSLANAALNFAAQRLQDQARATLSSLQGGNIQEVVQNATTLGSDVAEAAGKQGLANGLDAAS